MGSSFYWLTHKNARAGNLINAQVIQQTITIEGEDLGALKISLNDELIDLDKNVEVIINGKVVFNDRVYRTTEVIGAGISRRLDVSACPTAEININP